MPRYFFHVEDGTSRSDEESTELENIVQAKCEAVKLAGRLICDEASEFWDRSQWKMTVTDDTGLILCILEVLGTEAPAGQTGARSRQG